MMANRYRSPPRSDQHSQYGQYGALPRDGQQEYTELEPDPPHAPGTWDREPLKDHNDPHMATISSYEDYPASRPFIYDDYRRDPAKLASSYPESNRQAIMSALRGLQDKITHLEVERTQAEKNLRSLATETSRYRGIVTQDAPTSVTTTQTGVSRDTQGVDSHVSMATDAASDSEHSVSKETPLDEHDPEDERLIPVLGGVNSLEMESQLQSAEARCQLLERQLDYMRQMVQSSDKERSDAVRRSTALQHHREESEQHELRSQIEKIAELERDHLRLTATQTLAESKIRELEENLKEERLRRRLMQDKTAELETNAAAGRILMETASPEKRYKRTVKKKKKKQVVSKPVRKNITMHTVASASRSRSPNRPASTDPMDHYRLNLAEIPFIAGKSTAPSHSLPANVQKVLSLMKSHNPKLCPTSPRVNSYTNGYVTETPVGSYNHRSSSSSGVSTGSDLADLLVQLQDEFGHMSFDHQELSRQIHEATDLRMREDLERELDTLVSTMEAKGDQIARLRRHQEMMIKKERKIKKKGKVSSTAGDERPHSASARLPQGVSNGVVEVTTTVRTKGKTGPSMYVCSGSAAKSKAQANLALYKDLKKVQSTLRKDDLSWDC